MIRFAENLNKMIAAGLGGALEAPRTEVAVGHRLVYTEASGAVASFETNVIAPVKNLRVTMEPIQNLNGQDAPYPAGGGKNLFNINGIVVGNTTNWGITVNGDTVTVEHKTSYTTGIPSFAFNQPSGTYVVSVGSVNIPGQISLYVNDKWSNTINNGDTFTIDSANKNEIKFSALTDTPTVISKLQVEKGTTATAYAPYSNICPITGRESVTVTRTGKNLFDKSAAIFGILNASGDIISTTQVVKKVSDFIPVVPGGKYYVQNVVPGSDSRPGFWYNASKTGLSMATLANNSATSGIFTAPSDAAYIRISAYAASEDTTMLEVGSTPSSYVPYDGQSATIQLGQTVYGGTVDVTTGTMTVDWAFIASYNGEELPGEWISDRDVYAPGTTPTIGAQVCYKLAEPQTIQLTPAQLTTPAGENNIWSDAGNISLEYPYYEETEGY